MTDGWSTTNILAYDPVGRILASQQALAGQTYNFSYGYNLADALTSETYPSGRVITSSHDVANRVKGVTGLFNSANTTYVTSFAYAPHGAPGSYVYGNNLAHVAQFNSRLQPNAMWDAVGNSANAFEFMLYPNWGVKQ